MARHVIVLFKKQESRKTTYPGYDCYNGLFYCIDETVPCRYTDGIQDPVVGTVNCALGCPAQNLCLKPDPAEGDIGLSSYGLDPLLNISWDIVPYNIKCFYDLDRIDTESQINAIKNKFPAEQFNHIMRAFCVQKSTSCLLGRPECSRLTAVDTSGEMCREWLSKQDNGFQDSVKREYCIKNNTDDCKCINRSRQSDFNELKNGMNAQTLSSSRCWYKPCDDNSNILLDSEQKQSCQANVCQNIIEAHANGNIDINNNTSSLNCNFTSKEIEAANEARKSKLSKPSPTNTTKNTTPYFISFLSDNKVIIVIVIVIFIVITLLLKRLT